MFIVQRATYFTWIILLIVMLLLSPMNWRWLHNSTNQESFGPSTATELVADNGFTLALAGVTISGGADVAPTGTNVHAELITPELPDSVSDFAEPVGTGVEITLDDNLQPASPITITFAASEVTEWYAATEGDEDLMPIVFASNDGELGVEFADASLMADGSVVVTADHLSGFYPGVTRVSSFSDRLVDEIAVLFGAQSDQPTCFDRQTSDSEWAVTGILDEVFWPCITETASGVNLKLTNNSPEVWIVSSSQASPGLPGISSLTGILIATGGRLMLDPSTTVPLMPPDGTVTVAAAVPEGEIEFDAQMNYGLTTANAVVSATVAFLPPSKVKQILDKAGEAECWINFIQEAFGGVRVDGSFVRTVIDCMGAYIEGLPGALISSVTTVPGATIAMADATYRTLAGTDQFTFTLFKVSSDVSAWPINRSDSGGSLYTWLGANMYGFPDWVACDNAREWCLVGYNGERHLLVQMDGLNAMYWIDDNVASPRDALLSTGLSETVVSEILGD